MICPYGDNCFTCPLPDCELPAHLTPKANELPTDREKFNITAWLDKELHGRKTGT